MEDPVHQVVQAEAVAVHDHVAVAHRADHAAHVAEASPVDVPNQSRQRVAVARSRSKYLRIYRFFPIQLSWLTHFLIIFLYLSFQTAIAICPNQNQRAAVAAVTHAPAPAPNHTSAVILAIPVTVHCRRAPKTDITPDQVPQKIMAVQEAPQTEMKAWMIKLTLLRPCNSKNKNWNTE